MNEYTDSDTDAVIEGPAKSYIPGLAVVTGGDPSSGAYQYQLRDRLGSVRDIRSQAKARLAEYTFEPYGDVRSASGLALNQGFTGHTWDAALGMYHTAYRHYSPGMARWMSRDPLGMVDGPNLYGYVGGDPVNFYDVFGLELVSREEGQCILDKAKEWQKRDPPWKYAPGYDPKGGTIDCSHFVNEVYKEAGFPMEYASTGDFAKLPQMKEIRPEDAQPGDAILHDGHVGFWDPDYEGKNKGGKKMTELSSYSPGIKNSPPDYFRGKPRFFRYDKPNGSCDKGKI